MINVWSPHNCHLKYKARPVLSRKKIISSLMTTFYQSIIYICTISFVNCVIIGFFFKQDRNLLVSSASLLTKKCYNAIWYWHSRLFLKQDRNLLVSSASLLTKKCYNAIWYWHSRLFNKGFVIYNYSKPSLIRYLQPKATLVSYQDQVFRCRESKILLNFPLKGDHLSYKATFSLEKGSSNKSRTIVLCLQCGMGDRVVKLLRSLTSDLKSNTTDVDSQSNTYLKWYWWWQAQIHLNYTC